MEIKTKIPIVVCGNISDENRPHRANGEMAFHVLDLMQSFEEPERSKYMETL